MTNFEANAYAALINLDLDDHLCESSRDQVRFWENCRGKGDSDHTRAMRPFGPLPVPQNHQLGMLDIHVYT